MKSIKRRQFEAITRAAQAATEAIAVVCSTGVAGVAVACPNDARQKIEEYIIATLDHENGGD